MTPQEIYGTLCLVRKELKKNFGIKEVYSNKEKRDSLRVMLFELRDIKKRVVRLSL